MYRCKVCKALFGARKTVRRHLRDDHGVKGPNYTGTRERMPSEITDKHEYVGRLSNDN